jgi:hypothetical protein
MIVDVRSQRALILRVVLYWILSIFAVAMLMILWDAGRGKIGPLFTADSFSELLQRYGSLFVAALVVLPVLVADAWIQSNRIAGPVYRLRTCLLKIAAGEPVEKVVFRKGDYWPGLADDLNAAINYVEALRAQAQKAADYDDESALEAISIG